VAVPQTFSINEEGAFLTVWGLAAGDSAGPGT